MTLFRILAFTLCVVLVYTLYLPSANPPERFLQQMRIEHELNVAFWGEDHAHQILERSLSLYAQQDNLAPAAFASTPSVAVRLTEPAAILDCMGARQINSGTRNRPAIPYRIPVTWNESIAVNATLATGKLHSKTTESNTAATPYAAESLTPESREVLR